MIGRKTYLAAAAALAAAVLWMGPLSALAKPGAVTTSDGSVFVGDVTEVGTKVTVTDDKGSGIEIDKANVRSTKYFETPKDEFDVRLGQLAATDAKGRVDLARWAIKQNQPELAKEALDGALKIDPKHTEASILRKSLDTPTTAPGPDGGPAMAPDAKPRMVTKEEVNRIRQIEWQPGDDAVRLKIDKEARDTFLARSRTVTPAQFNKMSQPDQARLMLREGGPEQRAGVQLMSDPVQMANYRRNIQKMVLTGCAAGGCHDATTKTNFLLHTDPTDEAAYTNYLILQNHRSTVDGVVRLMVDRDQPQNSLLSEYMLPYKVANTPHPEVEGFAGAIRTVQDPRFKLLSQWIRGLPTIAPDYGIDLTKPAEDDQAPGAPLAPGEPAPPAAPAPAGS